MTEPSALPIHWRYAAGNAFRALEMQVREFDFVRYADGHTYSGLKPQEYIEIVDGFLAEDSTVVPGGNRRALEELRKLLVHHILAAFNVGWDIAIELWNDSDREYASVATSDLHVLARERSPFAGTKCEWFVEGFCQSWAQAEMNSLRG
jgi:hypothetical protein